MNTNNDKRDRRQEDDELKIYGPGGSTLQTPEEHEHDQQVDPRKDSTISVSNDDLHTTDVEKMQDQLDGSSSDDEDIADNPDNEK